MKKCIFMLMLVAGGYVAMAQTDSMATNTATNNTLSSSANYSAYSAPANIQMYLTRDYPTAVNVTWMPMNEYWRATYNNMGRYNHVYYATNGDHYTVALPVTSTWVPDEIISRAGSMYGANIYDVITLKGANGNTVYQVRMLDNGVLKSEWIDEAGTKVTEYYRTDDASAGTIINNNPDTKVTTDAGMSTDVNMGSTETKVKTKTENGKTKTKIKNH